MVTVRGVGTLPVPRHLEQGLDMVEPLPPQRVQTLSELIMPNAVRCVTATRPVPRQSGQVCLEEPGAAPLPLQSGHCSIRLMRTSTALPLTASIKPMVISVLMSCPLLGALGFARVERPKEEPPKIEPNISPISPRSPKSEKPEKPPAPAPAP